MSTTDEMERNYLLSVLRNSEEGSMTPENQNDTDARLSPIPEEEGFMAEIPCANCGHIRELRHVDHVREQNSALWGGPNYREELLRGSIRCAGCGYHTLFEMEGDKLTFLPGNLYQGDLEERIPSTSLASFAEAIRCLHGGGYRGAAGLCRTAAEEALDDKGVKGDNLEQKIENATGDLSKGALLGIEQNNQAHASRLAGNAALHKSRQVTLLQIQLVIGTTIELLNHIASRP